MTWFGDNVALAERLDGIEPELRAARYSTVLDVGSAEGLIAREFCRHGARYAHCITLKQSEIDAGKIMCTGHWVKFYRANVADGLPDGLQTYYDIGLLLSILQKIPDPGALLDEVIPKVDRLIVRVPAPVFRPKHGGDFFDIVDYICDRMKMESTPKTNRGWLGIWVR